MHDIRKKIDLDKNKEQKVFAITPLEKNKLFIFLLLIAIVVFASLYAFMARANMYYLYATSCLGGWENTHLAAGSPEVIKSGRAPGFNNENSARLIADAYHAQIYCGGFSGDILPDTIPKKILVKFSWAIEYPNIPIKQEIILNEKETTSIKNESEQDSLLVPEPTSEIIPQIEEPTIQLFYKLVPVARAQESPQEITDSTAATTTPDTETTTIDAATTTAESSYGLVEVLYTLDGIVWKSLGFVGKDEFGNKYFEIPIEEASAWEDISKIQISIQSVPVLDSVAPVIYLDSVWLEVEYQNLLEDPNAPPGERKGDIILSEIRHENMAVVLISRNLNTFKLFFPDSPKKELWLALISSAPVLDDTLTTDSATIPPLIKKEWRMIADDSLLAENPRVLFDDGNVFWVGKNDTALWRFNTQTNGYSSVSISEGEPTRLYFEDRAGEERVLEASSENLETLLIIEEPKNDN